MEETLSHIPKISIGFAVYNGERYLKEALDSILAQTYADFELIISDNASTDKTEEICRTYAEKDVRIRYSRNEKNIGGANNENRTFALARGKYFRLAAHDDILAPELLAELVKVLEQDPSIVLCYSNIIKIDGEGNETGVLDGDIAVSEKASVRFRELFDWFGHDCETTYGLVRSDVLRKTELQLNYTDSDRTLLCELSLHGKFYRIPKNLFYKRYHAEMSTQIYYEHRERMAWFNPEFDVKKQIALPHWMQFFHYLRIIARAPLSLNERMACFGSMFYWLYLHQRWARMIKDLIFAGEIMLNSLLKRQTVTE